MRALVVGLGSAGSRHARLLQEIGCQVAVLSMRESTLYPVFGQLQAAVDDWHPGYVVVANKTHQHHSTVLELINMEFGGRVLVEKPLFDRAHPLPPNSFRSLNVGYNLRFHPLLGRVRDLLSGQTPLSASAYAGQYLPTWRPSSDYRSAYSARCAEGGGVLRDLSHEIDYLGWLFGRWSRLTALGGHFSRLEIDSDDLFTLLLSMENCPVVCVQMNYLDRAPRRELLVHTNDLSLKIDFIRGILQIDDIVELIAIDPDATSLAMHRAVLAGDQSVLCTVDQATDVLHAIAGAEAAARVPEWIGH